MSAYRFLTTNILTGQILGDYLPITAQSVSRVINTSGPATVSLNLTGSTTQNAANINAVQPRRSALWVLQDNSVIYGGPIYDWNHESVTDGVLPLGCSTFDSMMAHRVISLDFKFTNTDVFDMVRTLVRYAVSKTPNGQIAGLTYSSGESGIRDTMTFIAADYGTVSDALSTLVSAYEIEYSFRPYQDANGNLKVSLDLAYPYLGQPFPASGLVYSLPGNLTDYAFQATGSTSANSVTVTAWNSSGTSDASLFGSAKDLTDLNAGYPLSETVLSLSNGEWQNNPQVAAFAAGYLPKVTDTQLTPVLTLPGGTTPTVAQTPLGSFCQVSFTSALHPSPGNGVPGFSGIGRVTGWTVKPPGAQQAETTEISLGNMLLQP